MALTVQNSSPTLSRAGQVFWIGNDGNVYLHNGDGTATNMGAATGTGTTANLVLNGASQITNPGNPGTPTGGGGTPAPSNPTGVTHPALNVDAVNNTQGTIDQIPGILQAALQSEDQTHQNSMNTFNQQQNTQQATHDASTTTNQQNYDANFMDSIRAGVKGLGSLVSMLRGNGAGNGTAEDQVRDVVGSTTAGDIRNGADTLRNNQNSVDSSLSQFLTDLSGKRQANEDIHTNNTRAIQRDSNTQLQDLYSKMAGFYGTAGDTGNASAFMAKAGALTPAIAANTRTAVSNYDTTPVVIHAPNLTAFSAPSQPVTASLPSNGQVGSGIFSLDKRKDNAPATDPAAAPASTVPAPAPALVPQGA